MSGYGAPVVEGSAGKSRLFTGFPSDDRAHLKACEYVLEALGQQSEPVSGPDFVVEVARSYGMSRRDVLSAVWRLVDEHQVTYSPEAKLALSKA